MASNHKATRWVGKLKIRSAATHAMVALQLYCGVVRAGGACVWMEQRDRRTPRCAHCCTRLRSEHPRAVTEVRAGSLKHRKQRFRPLFACPSCARALCWQHAHAEWRCCGGGRRQRRSGKHVAVCPWPCVASDNSEQAARERRSAMLGHLQDNHAMLCALAHYDAHCRHCAARSRQCRDNHTEGCALAALLSHEAMCNSL